MSFSWLAVEAADIPERLREALRRLGYRQLNALQVASLDFARAYENLLLVAPTGSGKTEAALLPILEALLKDGGEPVNALYVTPLRALNRDIHYRVKELVELLGFSAEIRHGDTPQSARRRIAEKPPHLLITTPETLQYLLVDKKLRPALRNVKWVVVDELHELLDDKRGTQLALALERLRLIAPKLRVIGLSATLRDPHAALRFLVGSRPGKVVEWEERKSFAISIEEPPASSDGEALDPFGEAAAKIAELAKSGGVLVFTNTRDTAELLGRVLSKDYSLEVRVHHGSLSRAEREEAEHLFRSEAVKAVVATSSLELGIDIGYVKLVVQYGSPKQAVKLIQRVGRAGHKLHETSRGVVIPLGLEDMVEAAVLARRALRKNLEQPRLFQEPLDVLAHQVAGLIMEHGPLPFEKLYRIVTRAHPYENLSAGRLARLLRFLEQLGVLRFDGEHVKMGRRTISYYFSSASMIPDTPSLEVVDAASRRTIGHLDYSFASLLDRGKSVILGGRTWLVEDVDVESGKVIVRELFEELGEPPVWTGASLPVEWRAAREVGSLYRRVAEALGDPVKLEKLRKEYMLPPQGFSRLVSLLEKQVRGFGFVPHENYPTIEVTRQKGRVFVVVHSYLGTRGNSLLAILLAYAARAALGVTVKYFSDPYRVLLIAQRPLSRADLESILKSGLQLALANCGEAVRESYAYELELLHTAGRVGVIDRRRLKELNINLKILKKRLRGTPADEEALQSCFVEHFDLESVERFAEKVSRGLFVIAETPELSPLSQLIFEKPAVRVGIMASGIPVEAVLVAVKRRLESSKVVLFCALCNEWQAEVKVADAKSVGSCPKCGSRALAVLRSYELSAITAFKKWRRGGMLSEEEKKLVEKVRQSANLYMSYGYRAVLALAGHGIGPSTARNILSKSSDEEDLLRNILEAELNYTKNRKYWED
ncbi:MAG: DEAD/DEAH box helicase [Thermofilum sp.]